ncbi:MAG TPA: hypothetical protein VE343_11880 [Streptosporangiaceae bacterium]|nr:hypothetical protein [Streptosporangiaceae bacterium]
MDGTPQGNGMLRAGSTYLLLFLLGVLEGLIGCFQYSRSIGGVPAGALAFCVLVFATCLLAGIGMGSARAALTAAAGWLLASLVLTLPTGGGSVIVANTAAGLWYVYGGAVCAAAAVIAVAAFRARLALRRGTGAPR